MGISCSVMRYEAKPDNDDELRAHVREIGRKRQRFGHLRITAILRREGRRVNHNLVYRICREEGLLLPRLRRKRLRREAVPVQAAMYRNQRWAMDFVHDALAG